MTFMCSIMATAKSSLLEAGRFGESLRFESASPHRWAEAAFRDEYFQLPITVEGWVRLDPQSNQNILLAAGLREFPGHWEISCSTSTRSLPSVLPGNGSIPPFDSAALADGNWHYIAAILEKDRVRQYIDAKLVSDKPSHIASAETIAARFGSPAGPGNLAFVGNGAKTAIADSEMAMEFHRARNLNDGKYGNNNSWIPKIGRAHV